MVQQAPRRAPESPRRVHDAPKRLQEAPRGFKAGPEEGGRKLTQILRFVIQLPAASPFTVPAEHYRWQLRGCANR